MIMESLGVADTKDIVDMFFNLLIEKQDLQIAPLPKSPFKPAIVPVPKDGSFKKLVCPIDVDAYDIEAVKTFLGDFPKHTRVGGKAIQSARNKRARLSDGNPANAVHTSL